MSATRSAAEYTVMVLICAASACKLRHYQRSWLFIILFDALSLYHFNDDDDDDDAANALCFSPDDNMMFFFTCSTAQASNHYS